MVEESIDDIVLSSEKKWWTKREIPIVYYDSEVREKVRLNETKEE